MINGQSKLQSIMARKGSRDSNKRRRPSLALRVQLEMIQNIHVAVGYDMMRLIHKHQLVTTGVKLHKAFRCLERLDRCDGNISHSRCMAFGHFDIDGLVWICVPAMSRGLLHQLPPMRENECLSCIFIRRRHPVDKVCEDDRLASASGQRETESFLAFVEISQDSVDAIFLIVSQTD